MTDESVDDIIESKQTFLYRVFVSIALAMISFGQFNDTRELLGDLYDDVTARFTHQLEYDKLGQLSIGRTIEYVDELLGPPEVRKQSSYYEGLSYQYYDIGKAVITVFNHNGRMSGFVVIPTVSDFSPTMLYVDETLGEQTIASAFTNPGDFYFDANNLVYFAEAQDLGKQFLFMQLVTGFVEYSELATVDENTAPAEQTISEIGTLNDLLLADDQDQLAEQIYRFRENHFPNFYGFTELDPSLIAESLLTRLEFVTYFGVQYD